MVHMRLRERPGAASTAFTLVGLLVVGLASCEAAIASAVILFCYIYDVVLTHF